MKNNKNKGAQDSANIRFDIPPLDEQERMVEAILFAASAPQTAKQMLARLPQGCDVAEVVSALQTRYKNRGVRVVKVGDGWAFRTAPDLGFLMRKDRVEARKLSRAAMETLAIVAYHQPVTRGEIEEIRGVAVSRGTLDVLLELDWIKLGRRRASPGRPVTFLVTETFLDHFGLESVGDLPGLKELRDSGLLDNAPPSGLMEAAFGQPDNADGEGVRLDEDEDEDLDEDEELFE